MLDEFIGEWLDVEHRSGQRRTSHSGAYHRVITARVDPNRGDEWPAACARGARGDRRTGGGPFGSQLAAARSAPVAGVSR
jgi:hypothetical protein